MLDLFAGAGGAGVGYSLAGYEVVGIDVTPSPHYPFDCYAADALDVLRSEPDWVRTFDLIHASPPCQGSSMLTRGTNGGNRRRRHPQLIVATRKLLRQYDIPSVIENVRGALVRPDLVLCGEMYGLDVIRHRYFEVSVPVVQPAHVEHRGRVQGWRHGEFHEGPYVAVYGLGGRKGSVASWRRAMHIDWPMTRRECAEAIPPAYTHEVGAQVLAGVHA